MYDTSKGHYRAVCTVMKMLVAEPVLDKHSTRSHLFIAISKGRNWALGAILNGYAV